jgi:membrane-associated phospholipid phosphatase
MPQTNLIAVGQGWHEAWQAAWFRRRVMTGLVLIIVILSCFPVFFQAIERRHGMVMNDRFLRFLPAHNVSLAIFLVIWAISAFFVVRAVRTPQLFLTFLWAYILLSLFRMLTISVAPLDPPAGLIPLADPISNYFYGARFVTRDLFFSGHTSTVFLLYLCSTGRTDKSLALLATLLVGFLLLVQHVHYTVDVIGGFAFAWISYWLARRLILH